MPHSEALGAEIFLASPCLAGGAADGDHDLDRRRDRLVDPWVVGVVEMPFPSPIAANSLPQGAFEIHPHPTIHADRLPAATDQRRRLCC